MKIVQNRMFWSGTFVLLVIIGAVLNSLQVAAQNSPAGPPSGLGVQVLNVPLPVTATGSTTVSGSVAATQSGTWNVGITGNPVVQVAQRPISMSLAPTCDALNRCFVKFPAVPANNRLRVTRIHGALFFQTADAFVAMDVNDTSSTLFLTPITKFGAAYNGTVLSFNMDTDMVFEAGQIPIVEVGNGTSITVDAFNRLGITGELVAVFP